VFMEKGEFRFTGATSELLERPDILRSVFIEGAGTSTASAAPEAKAAPKRKGRLQAARPAAIEVPLRTPPPPDAPVILECAGVTKRFGGITAVDQVDLQLREGQILGLIGQNGAGKTTLFDCVSGFLPVDGGRI